MEQEFKGLEMLVCRFYIDGLLLVFEQLLLETNQGENKCLLRHFVLRIYSTSLHHDSLIVTLESVMCTVALIKAHNHCKYPQEVSTCIRCKNKSL